MSAKNICPITYQELKIQEKIYSSKGLKLLSSKLNSLNPLDFDSESLIQEAIKRADKLSIPGIQPKLIAKLNIKNSRFDITNKNGTYILKPQHELYKQAPENEDLTMRLAKTCGIEVPLHGLVYTRDDKLCYFIKRFDRYNRSKKISVEDFAQLSGNDRDTKYNYSMEKVVGILDKYTSFPVLEKSELFLRLIVNYILGNEDMHLKNYSLIVKNNKVTLSPAYDLINSTLALGTPKEEIALSINGRKNNLRRKDFIDYYAKERLNLNSNIIEKQLNKIIQAKKSWEDIINKSFLTDDNKQKYLDIINSKSSVLGL
jgi:serine/threonine-protein kinase HipA